MPVKKRGRDSDLADDIDDYESDAGFVVSEDDKPRSKKPKATKPSAATKSSSNTANANEPFWEVSSTLFSSFLPSSWFYRHGQGYG